jgi:chemotaxis family two-component system response regulator Rcp1
MMGIEATSILLVEDNPDDVELTRIAMQEVGITADLSVVADGHEALRFLRREDPWVHAERPDMILLDLNLPQLDGRDLLRTIKTDDELCSIPVVVLTTSVDRNDVRDAYDAHANSFISKPADYSHFVEALDALRRFWFGIAELPDKPR